MAIYRPPFIKQLDGSTYGGRNCTMASAAMAAVRHKRGVNPAGTAPWYPRPADLRRKSGDKSGGTTLAQADSVLIKYYGINMDVEYVLPFTEFRDRILGGEGAIVQGGYGPIKNTKYSGSDTFSGNHAVYINEARYNERFNRWDYLWYDPLCDGRRAGIPKGPQWLPEWLVRKFTNALNPSGQRGDTIRENHVYASFTRDTEGVVEKFGGVELPSPILFRAKVTTKPRRAPRLASDYARILTSGSAWTAYQKTTTGDLFHGTKVWYGNSAGTQWIPADRLAKVSR